MGVRWRLVKPQGVAKGLREDAAQANVRLPEPRDGAGGGRASDADRQVGQCVERAREERTREGLSDMTRPQIRQNMGVTR